MGNCLGTKNQNTTSNLDTRPANQDLKSLSLPGPRVEGRQETMEKLDASDNKLLKAWWANEKKLAGAYGDCPALKRLDFHKLDLIQWPKRTAVQAVPAVRQTEPPILPSPVTIILDDQPCRVEGAVVRNVPMGHVKIYYPNKDIFEGFMSGGKFEGEGTFISENGQRFEGTYSRGEKHGPATLTQPDGSKLRATWINGRKEGPAIIERPDGSKLHCCFERDRLVGTSVELSSQGDWESKVVTLVDYSQSFPQPTAVYLSATRN